MVRALSLLLVLGALVGGGVWLLAPRARSRAGAVEAGDAASEATRPGDARLVPANGLDQDEPSASPAQRTAVTAAPADQERSEAYAITGRVIFPPGTPADEEAWVVASAWGHFTEDGRTEVIDSIGELAPSRPPASARARVMPDGSFRIGPVPRIDATELELQARYLALVRRTTWKRDESAPLVLEPVLGGRIVATLHLPQGAADVRGSVRLRSLGRDAQRRKSSLGERSSFAFDALFAEPDYLLELEAPPWIGHVSPIAIEPGVTTKVELVAWRGASIAGVVRDEHGVALEGVSVSATVDEPVFESARRRVETDASGAFVLQGLCAGNVNVRAFLDGRRELELELGRIEDGESRTGVELVLARGGTISGIVRWPDGKPAALSIVEAFADGAGSSAIGSWLERVSTRAGNDGRFELLGLAEGDYVVRASGQRDGAELHVERVAVPAGARDVELVLTRGLVLAGTVVDERGEPLENFSLKATPARARGTRDSLQRSYEDRAGAFELAGFDARDWFVRATSSGHAESERVRITMPCEPVRLVVPREAVVSGVVLDESGKPAPRVRVTACAERRNLDEPVRFDRTDGAGRFHIGRLRAGTISVSAEYGASASVKVEGVAGEETGEVVLRLLPEGERDAPR